jgi:putative membrane protein
MLKTFFRFSVRWFANSLGLYVAARIFELVDYQNRWGVIVTAGLVLAILNVLIRPVLIIFTLPAIALTLGIFMIVINGLIVSLASWLYEPLQVSSFWAAMLVGIVIGLVNYMVSAATQRLE